MAIPVAGIAEPNDRADRGVVRARATDKPAASAAARSSPVQPPAVARNAASAQGKPWSIEDALPGRPQDSAPPPASSIGRVPVRSGSVGFETETKIKPNEFADGRRTPGLETTTREPPSYLGLSLSVPTHDKSMLLGPLMPAWGRPDSAPQ